MTCFHIINNFHVWEIEDLFEYINTIVMESIRPMVFSSDSEALAGRNIKKKFKKI